MYNVQGLNVLQPRFLSWLGQLGGVADCMLMQHPLLQAHGHLPANSMASAPSGFSNGTWRGMEDLLGLRVHFDSSSQAETVWLDCLIPQVSMNCWNAMGQWSSAGSGHTASDGVQTARLVCVQREGLAWQSRHLSML